MPVCVSQGPFHGIQTSEKNSDRPSCGGAALITNAWNDWKASGREQFTIRVERAESGKAAAYSRQKHHVDLLEFGIEEFDLARLDSCDYRLKCHICSQDVIGPRFSCIHCPGGLECCLACSQDDENLMKYHDPSHAFQVKSVTT